MRATVNAFIGSLIAGILVLGGYLVGQHYIHQCPCGFVWSSQANGCIVDIYHNNPCPGQSASNSPGQPGGGGPGGPGQEPPGFPVGGCGDIVCYPCGFTSDFQAITLGLWWNSPASLVGEKVDVEAVSRDASGTACVEIAGTVAYPGGTTMTIPLDAAAAVASFPSLKASGKPGCVAKQFSMIARPVRAPLCGCKQSAIRP